MFVSCCICPHPRLLFPRLRAEEERLRRSSSTVEREILGQGRKGDRHILEVSIKSFLNRLLC
jgi:hypothetical protein